MAVSAEYKAFINEMLEPIGGVSIRGMFGGGGVFCQGVMFGLIADERLYFKVDDGLQTELEAEGSEPFTYEAKGGKRGVMSYYEAPERCYDDQDDMLDWARKALEAAFREDAKKPKSKQKRTG
ncbi:MAG: TfoX/Sxy family protein [Alphaproteobacteria bacterium]